MVRRVSRRARQEALVPAWCLDYVPEDWSGRSEYRQAVMEHAHEIGLRSQDLGVWLDVMSHAYAVRSGN